MSNPRICIVGAGKLSSRRIYPYIATAGGELVGICNLDAEKAGINARRYGGKVYQDLEKMLEEQKPDAVIVCIGPEMHAKLSKQILKLGYPVYTEKPPAACAEDALEVARTAKETGLLCTTAFKKRYAISSSRAKEWLAKFREEDFYSLSVDYCSAQYVNIPPKQTFLLDFAIHLIDLTQYLFGDVESVFAFSKGLDAYAVSLRFANGSVGSLNLNDGRSFGVPTEEIEITVKGGNFMTIHNSSVWKITENQKPCEWREPPTFTSAGDSGRDTGHLAEIEDFFNALKEKRTTRSNIYESYKSLVLLDAIQKSSETGQIIKLEYQSL